MTKDDVAETAAVETAVSPHERRNQRRAILKAQMCLHQSRWVRWSCLVAGTLLVGLGVPGLFLPVMPGTPLLLLAAFFYARGSEKFYLWLLTNRVFGDYVYDWHQAKGVPLHIKIKVSLLLVGSVAITILFIMPPILAAQLSMGVICAGVLIYIWRQPTAADPRKKTPTPQEADSRS